MWRNAHANVFTLLIVAVPALAQQDRASGWLVAFGAIYGRGTNPKLR
jgi:hypothetical protein